MLARSPAGAPRPSLSETNTMPSICCPRARARSLALLTLAVLGSGPASAVDVLGLYVGGAAGQGQVEAGSLESPAPTFVPVLPDFRATHSAFKVVAGVRPLSVVGVEVAYVDFGRANKPLGGSSAGIFTWSAAGDVRLSGSAAFGIVYLPIPLVDVYAKAGVARLKTTADVTLQVVGPVLCPTTAPNCRFTQQSSTTNTGFAAGAGVGFKLGAIAIHAEYERFTTPGAYPALTTLGVSYTFL
jgi:opacity protein-like surface antigen